MSALSGGGGVVRGVCPGTVLANEEVDEWKAKGFDEELPMLHPEGKAFPNVVYPSCLSCLCFLLQPTILV